MEFNYEFLVKKFECNGVQHNVALTPVLFRDEDNGLDFSGSIVGTLISESFGTRNFMLENLGLGEWLCSEGGLEEGVAKSIIQSCSETFSLDFEIKLYRVEVPQYSGDN